VSLHKFWQVKYSEATHGDRTVADTQELWQPPPASTFKVNWDVGFNPKMKRMRVGIIVRYVDGLSFPIFLSFLCFFFSFFFGWYLVQRGCLLHV
jgi:hypothetical protein